MKTRKIVSGICCNGIVLGTAALQMDIAGLFPEPQGQQMVYKLHRHVFSALQAL